MADFKFTKRWEFEQYLQWIVSHFDNVKFNIKVEEVSKMQKISSPLR
ncbi:SidA/IucD/PvdA family monooxygenase [Haemophilus parahaemolyticus]